jgi:hypothetical protein
LTATFKEEDMVSLRGEVRWREFGIKQLILAQNKTLSR